VKPIAWHELEIDPRYVKMGIDAMIQHDPVKAAIELIQNADDSYSRLESLGIEVEGRIKVDIVERRAESSWLSCTDWAEGFAHGDLKQKVGTIGKKTSGLVDGARVTGVFGRGLKEALLGFDAGGDLHSIRDGRIAEAKLYWNDDPLRAVFAASQPATSVRAFRKEFGISINGTVIDVEIKRGVASIPQHTKLAEILRGHFRLRRILSDPNRQIILGRNRRLRGTRAQEDIAIPAYMYPVEDPAFQQVVHSGPVPGFPVTSFSLRLRRALEPLAQAEAGAQRQGGLLVTSHGAVLDIGFFNLEGHPGTRHLFGEVVCDHIYDLVRKDETVIDLTRDGLDRSHPFINALLSEIEGVITPTLQQEAKRISSEAVALSKTISRDTFETALRDLNEIAFEELGEDMPVVPGDKPSNLTEFAFSRALYELAPGGTRSTWIRVPRRMVADNGGILRLVSSDERLLVAPAEEQILLPATADVADVPVELLADGAEFTAELTAFYGEERCHASVVVSTPAQVPMSDLSFEHSSYRLKPNRRRALLLIADRHVLSPGDEVIVELIGDSPDSYQIVSEGITLSEVPGNDLLLQADIEIFPMQIGAKAVVVARALNATAEAHLSCGEATSPPPPPPEGERALIRDLQFDRDENPPTQTAFLNGIVKVYTEHPLVKHYLGVDGERARTPEGSMLVKVLVTEALLDELVRLKDQRGRILAIRGDRATSLNYHRDELRKRHGLRIHRAVARMFVDKLSAPAEPAPG
jgi:hypothetical protein